MFSIALFYWLPLQRNEEAKQLHAQLQDRDGDKPEQWRGVAKAVRQELLSPHLAVENKLMVNNICIYELNT